MKKEEFPTYLNEQATILFGRTGRELLIFTAGGTGAFAIWNNMVNLRASTAGLVLCITLVVLVCIASVVVALFSVAGRPIEEWLFVLAFYFGMPKIFVFMPLDEEDEKDDDKKDKATKKQLEAVDDPFDEEDIDS